MSVVGGLGYAWLLFGADRAAATQDVSTVVAVGTGT